MQSENAEDISLRGSILLADPSLADPNFFRSVIYLSQHEQANGAEGFILNRQVGKNVGDLLSGAEFESLREVPVFFGGPVGTEHMILASLAPRPDTGQLDFQTRISTEQAINRQVEGFEIRAYVGYSGWAAGQLEREIKEHSWISQRAAAGLMLMAPSEMWQETLEGISPWHYVLSKTPKDPFLN